MTTLQPDPAESGVRVAYPPREPSPRELARRTPEAVEAELTRRPKSWRRRPALLALAVQADDDQQLSQGAWRLTRFGQVTYEGLVLPDKASAETVGRVEGWAAGHPAAGRLARLAGVRQVHRLTELSDQLLRPAVMATGDPEAQARSARAWLATWDVGWTMSRLARDWSEAREEQYGGWSLGLFDVPPDHPDHRDAGKPGKGHPRLIVRQLNDLVTFARWGTLPAGEHTVKGRPPAVLDLRHLARALGGNGLDTLATACDAFEVCPPLAVGGQLDQLTDEVRAIAGLARALLAEADEWERRRGNRWEDLRPTGVLADPRNLYSAGGLAGQVLRSVGVDPLAERIISDDFAVHDQVVGAFAAASFGGRSEAMVVRTGEPATHWDFTGTYGQVARLAGASAVMLADRLDAERVGGEVTQELIRLASSPDLVTELLDSAWWRRWLLVAVEVRPNGGQLMVRVLTQLGEYSLRRAALHAETPSLTGGTLDPTLTCWTTMADLAAGLLAATSRSESESAQPQPEVVAAWRLVPEGKASGLRPVMFPGEVSFDPYAKSADLFASLTEVRDACRVHPDWSVAVRNRRTAAMKALTVSLASGVVARVDRQPVSEWRRRSRHVDPETGEILPETPGEDQSSGEASERGEDQSSGEASEPQDRGGDERPCVDVIGPDGARIEATVGGSYERPGPDNFPPLTTAITAGARLLLALVEAMVAQQGARVMAVLTDALTIPAGVDVAAVAERIRSALGVTLRPQHASDTQPVEAWIGARNHYVFRREGEVVHTSEFALGGVYVDPSGRQDVGHASGARAWVVEGLQAVDERYREFLHAGPVAGASTLAVPWAGRWAVSPFSAATSRQCKWLSAGGTAVRPFDQGLSLHVQGGNLLTSGVPGDPDQGGPVCRAPWSTDPERWPELLWHTRLGESVSLLGPGDERGLIRGPRPLTPQNIENVLWHWVSSDEPGAVPAHPGCSGEPYRGQLLRVPVLMVGQPHLIGKEGTDLTERMRGTCPLAEAVISYGNSDAMADVVARIMALLSPAERKVLMPWSAERAGQYAAGGRKPRDLSWVLYEAAMAAFRGLPPGQVPADPLARLWRWAELLERCQTPECDEPRAGRSKSCAACLRQARRRPEPEPEPYVRARRAAK